MDANSNIIIEQYRDVLKLNLCYESEFVISLLRQLLSESRFNHVMRVRNTAQELASKFQLTELMALELDQVVLFHDFAKGMSDKELSLYASEYDIDLSSTVPPMYHAVVGAWMMQKFFNVQNKELLQAVYFHTTGHPTFKTNTVGALLFLADYLEPGRNVERECITQWIPNDINKALWEVVKNKIIFVIQRERVISQESIEFYHSLI